MKSKQIAFLVLSFVAGLLLACQTANAQLNVPCILSAARDASVYQCVSTRQRACRFEKGAVFAASYVRCSGLAQAQKTTARRQIVNRRRRFR